MAWGKFCDGMYDKSKEAHWLEFLATCYLQARAAAVLAGRALACAGTPGHPGASLELMPAAVLCLLVGGVSNHPKTPHRCAPCRAGHPARKHGCTRPGAAVAAAAHGGAQGRGDAGPRCGAEGRGPAGLDLAAVGPAAHDVTAATRGGCGTSHPVRCGRCLSAAALLARTPWHAGNEGRGSQGGAGR